MVYSDSYTRESQCVFSAPPLAICVVVPDPNAVGVAVPVSPRRDVFLRRDRACDAAISVRAVSYAARRCARALHRRPPTSRVSNRIRRAHPVSANPCRHPIQTLHHAEPPPEARRPDLPRPDSGCPFIVASSTTHGVPSSPGLGRRMTSHTHARRAQCAAGPVRRCYALCKAAPASTTSPRTVRCSEARGTCTPRDDAAADNNIP